MNIVLTGGGTAGHIMPNLALVDDLHHLFNNIYYLGNSSGMEKKLSENYDLKFIHCDSIKFDRQHLLKNAQILFKLPKYKAQAKKILKDNNIDIVFSKGGYVSLPVVLAAHKLKIPVVCHESDMSLGLTNKITSFFAKATITSYEETKGNKNFVHIGTPLRKALLKPQPELVFNRHNIQKHQSILLIVGGSLGAKAINDIIIKTLDSLCSQFFVIHICGKHCAHIHHTNYVQLEFVNDIENYLAAATLIISRCGATIASEITALNKKVLYIPLENKASRGDQLENALYYKKHNYANVLLQNELTINNLQNAISTTLNMEKKSYKYDTMIIKKICYLLLKIAKQYST